MGEPWGIYCACFWEKWLRDLKSALYEGRSFYGLLDTFLASALLPPLLITARVVCIFQFVNQLVNVLECLIISISWGRVRWAVAMVRVIGRGGGVTVTLRGAIIGGTIGWSACITVAAWVGGCRGIWGCWGIGRHRGVAWCRGVGRCRGVCRWWGISGGRGISRYRSVGMSWGVCGRRGVRSRRGVGGGGGVGRCIGGWRGVWRGVRRGRGVRRRGGVRCRGVRGSWGICGGVRGSWRIGGSWGIAIVRWWRDIGGLWGFIRNVLWRFVRVSLGVWRGMGRGVGGWFRVYMGVRVHRCWGYCVVGWLRWYGRYRGWLVTIGVGRVAIGRTIAGKRGGVRRLVRRSIGILLVWKRKIMFISGSSARFHWISLALCWMT